MFTKEELIPTFSPQGDGNVGFGRGDNSFRPKVDPYLFPARGRKHTQSDKTAQAFGRVDPYLFPARGRKRPLNR